MLQRHGLNDPVEVIPAADLQVTVASPEKETGGESSIWIAFER